MEILNNSKGNGGVVNLLLENKEIGRLTYTLFLETDTLIISYVYISPEHEGKGLGKKLVEYIIDFSRKNNWKAVPHCSYARAVMNRMHDIEDVYTKE